MEGKFRLNDRDGGAKQIPRERPPFHPRDQELLGTSLLDASGDEVVHGTLGMLYAEGLHGHATHGADPSDRVELLPTVIAE